MRSYVVKLRYVSEDMWHVKAKTKAEAVELAEECGIDEDYAGDARYQGTAIVEYRQYDVKLGPN